MPWQRPSPQVQRADPAGRPDRPQPPAGMAARSSTARSWPRSPTDRRGPRTRRGDQPQQPGQPVLLGEPPTCATPAPRCRPNTGPEPLSIARELVRRGLDAATRWTPTASARGWRGAAFMEIAFDLTSDPAELHETARRVLAVDQRVRRRHLGLHRRTDRAGARRAHPRYSRRAAGDGRAASWTAHRYRRPAGRGPSRLRPDRRAHRGGHLERRTRPAISPGWTRPPRRSVRRPAHGR